MEGDTEKANEADAPETPVEARESLPEQVEDHSTKVRTTEITESPHYDTIELRTSHKIDSSASQSIYENPATLSIASSGNTPDNSVAVKRSDSLGSKHSTSYIQSRHVEPLSKVTHNDTEVPIHIIAPCKTTSCGFSKEIKIPISTLPPTVDYINQPSRRQNSGKNRKLHLELMKTFEGVLFVGEILSSLLSWILLVAWANAGLEFRMPCPLGYSLFVFIASFVTTVIWFFILLTGMDEKYPRMVFLREPPFGIGYNAIWALAYLIAGGIAASYAVTDMTQVLGACTAFAFIVFLLHTSHALVYFYRRYGFCPWQFLKGCNKECSTATI